MLQFTTLVFLSCLSLRVFHHATASDGGETTVSLHGVGTESPCVRYIMDLLEDECEQPCRLTYRVASQSNASQNILLKKYAFGVDQVPFKDHNNNDKIYTFPIGMSAWGLYSNLIFDDDGTGESNVGPYLNLTDDLIGQILFGNVTTWDDKLVLEQNPALKDFVGADVTFHDEIFVGIVKEEDGEPVSMTDILKQPWSAYLKSKVKSNIWPKQLDNIGVFDTIFLMGSTPQTVRDRMVAHEGLAIGFLPSQVARNTGMLNEVPLTNRNGKTLTLPQGESLYHVSNIPNFVEDDFGDFSTLDQYGENVWPLLITEYLFVRRDTFTNVLDDAQRGLLVALIESFYSKLQCGHKGMGGVTAGEIPAFRKLGFEGLKVLIAKPGIRTWHREEDDEIENNGFAITQQRQSYQRYEISQLTNEVTKVQDVIKSRSDDPNDKLDAITETVESLKMQCKNLAKKFEDMKSDDQVHRLLFDEEEQQQLQLPHTNIRRHLDDVALDMDQQQPTFTDRDQTNIEAALVLAGISFTLWMFYFVWRIWWFFYKP